MKLGILPKLAALAAAIAKPFRRKPKVKTYEAAAPVDKDAPRPPSLKGTGKASRALRKARRLQMRKSFSRLLAHKPMPAVVARVLAKDEAERTEADARVLAAAIAWQEAYDRHVKYMDIASREGGTVRKGSRAAKRTARLNYRLKVRAWKKAHREALDAAIGGAL